MKKLLLLLSIVFVTVTAFGQATGYDLSNFATSGSIGTAATTVDVYSRINIVQTTPSITLTIPKPTNTTTKVTEVWIANKGTVSLTLRPLPDLVGFVLDTGQTVILKWIGLRYAIVGKGNTVDLSGYIKRDGTSSATTGTLAMGFNNGLQWGTGFSPTYINNYGSPGSSNLSIVSDYSILLQSSNSGPISFISNGLFSGYGSSGTSLGSTGAISSFTGSQIKFLGTNKIENINTGGFNSSFDFTGITADRNIVWQNKDYTGVADLTDIVATDTTALMRKAGGVFTGNVNGVTPAQLGYVAGATSNIQTQLNSKIGLTSLSGTSGVIYNNTTGLIYTDATKVPYFSGSLSGTPSSTTFLKGNGAWSTLSLTDMPVFSGYTAGPGTVSSSDKAFTAIQKLDGNIQAITPLLEVGLIRDETFANLTDWNKVAGSWSTGGSGLIIPAGANNFTSAILNSRYNGTDLGTKYEKVTFEGTGLVIPTISGTTYGVSFGLNSISNPSAQNSIHVRFCMDATLGGHIQVYHNRSITTVYAQTKSPLPITAGDNTSFKIRRDGNVFVFTWTNNTQNNSSVTLQYNCGLNNNIVPPNYSVPAIWGNGAATTLTSWKWTCHEIKNPDILYISHSIGAGMLCDNGAQRMSELLKLLINEKIAVLSGAGDRIEDNNPNEVIAINPRNIIIFCLSNNVSTGQSNATILSNLSTFIGSLTGYTYNTNLFISKVMPRNDIDVSSFNTALIGAYAPSGLIDPYWTFKSNGGTGIDATKSKDGVHPNPESEYELMNVNFAFGLNKGIMTRRNYSQPYRRVAYYQGKNIRLGGSVGTAFASVDIANDDGTNQVRVGNTNLDQGAYLFNNGATWLSDNIGYNGTNYISKAATVTGVYQSGGVIRFMGGTGLTIGATLNATGSDRLQINASGLSTFFPNGNGVAITEAGNGANRGMLLSQYNAGSNPYQMVFQKSRNTTTTGGNTALVSGDTIAKISFRGADGTTKINSANIQAIVSGTVSAGVMPVDVVIYAGSTNTPTEQLRVSSNGITAKHIVGGGSAPTVAAGTGAGTGPTVSVTGTDMAGYISVTTGTLPTASATVATITFNVAYGSAPKCIQLTAANGNTAILTGVTSVYVDQSGITTSSFALTEGSAGLTAATAYKWYYTVIQ